MTTYSIAQLGCPADQVQQKQTLTLPDSMTPNGTDAITMATPGGMVHAMRRNFVMLCKGPDGALKNYTLDAERSTPTAPVLRAV